MPSLRFRKPKSPAPGMPSGLPGDAYSALEECNFVIASIGRKADKNKRNARRSAGLLTGSTALVPVCLIVAEQFAADGLGAFLFGRLFPGLLAAFAAVLARWIQIEQPHQRWTLYRSWQREFEAHRLRYRQRVAPYAGDDRDDLLAENLALGQLRLDNEWATLIPRSTALTEEIEGKPA